ncbi:hypothetical protein Tco_0092268 [Tanacetum coccineum]
MHLICFQFEYIMVENFEGIQAKCYTGETEPLFYNHLRLLTSLDEGLYALACEEDVCYLATLVRTFGKLLEDIHVTWTHLGKKRDKIAALHEVAWKIWAQCLETVSEIPATPSELTSDSVKTFVTASGCDGSIKYWTSSGVIGEKGWSVMSIDCIFLMLEVVEKSFRGGDVGGVQVKLGESDVDEGALGALGFGMGLLVMPWMLDKWLDECLKKWCVEMIIWREFMGRKMNKSWNNRFVDLKETIEANVSKKTLDIVGFVVSLINNTTFVNVAVFNRFVLGNGNGYPRKGQKSKPKRQNRARERKERGEKSKSKPKVKKSTEKSTPTKSRSKPKPKTKIHFMGPPVPI